MPSVMSQCVLCQRVYHTVGPPGTCPQCWLENALTESDRDIARGLVATETVLQEGKSALELAEAVLKAVAKPAGKVRLSRSDSHCVVRMWLGEGQRIKKVLRRDAPVTNVGEVMRGLACMWTAEGVGPEAARVLQDLVGVPVVCEGVA